MRSQIIFSVCVATLAVRFATFAWAGEPKLEYTSLAPDLKSVPQYLLNLAHAKEVQEEIGLSGDKLSEWENELREIDASWWPARILPSDEQRKAIATQEAKLMTEAKRILSADGLARLRQIELQAQGIRIVARPDVEKFLRIETLQHKKLAEIFAESDKLAAAIAATKPPADPAKLEAYALAKAEEPKKAMKVLTPAQLEKLRGALGETFETAQLKRIYPLAPELIDSGYWSGTEKVQLETLRGQVVLVHFYAFQCHNCVANFGHYKRWDETLKKRGVRLIGIQTPETAAERDPEKVIAAAKKEGFQFPVLIDVANKNWAAWGNTMWPTVYVIDKQGYIRFWWQGELNWQGATIDEKIEKIIDELIAE